MVRGGDGGAYGNPLGFVKDMYIYMYIYIGRSWKVYGIWIYMVYGIYQVIQAVTFLGW